jgi:hypothetical protein
MRRSLTNDRFSTHSSGRSLVVAGFLCAIGLAPPVYSVSSIELRPTG